jgi:hypothetical protein
MESSLGIALAVVLVVVIRWVAKLILRRMKNGPTKEMLSADVFTGDDPTDRSGGPRK